jgi:hypothetical protein
MRLCAEATPWRLWINDGAKHRPHPLLQLGSPLRSPCVGMCMAVLDVQPVAAWLPEIGAAPRLRGYLIAAVVAIPLTGLLTRAVGLRRRAVPSMAVFMIGYSPQKGLVNGIRARWPKWLPRIRISQQRFDNVIRPTSPCRNARLACKTREEFEKARPASVFTAGAHQSWWAWTRWPGWFLVLGPSGGRLRRLTLKPEQNDEPAGSGFNACRCEA